MSSPHRDLSPTAIPDPVTSEARRPRVPDGASASLRHSAEDPRRQGALVIFFRGPRPGVTYTDRSGKYQRQRGVTFPRVLA
mgnify:CR=1 FL=1